MLTDADYQRLGDGFILYDHAVDYYSTFLGEPFILDEYLCYFDGTLLQICAYSLRDPRVELTTVKLRSIVGDFESTAPVEPEAISVWGRIDSSCVAPSPRYRRAWLTNYDHADRDWALSPTEPQYATGRLARDIRYARRRYSTGLSGAITAQHLRLVSDWASRHDVAAPHLGFARGAVEYAKTGKAVIIDGWSQDRLAGWSVLCFIGKTCIILQTFGDNHSASGIGDALTAASVDVALSSGTTTMRWGYSATEGVSAFKRKWGARPDGPPYREALYLTGQHPVINQEGPFLWEQRLNSPNRPKRSWWTRAERLGVLAINGNLPRRIARVVRPKTSALINER